MNFLYLNIQYLIKILQKGPVFTASCKSKTSEHF